VQLFVDNTSDFTKMHGATIRFVVVVVDGLYSISEILLMLNTVRNELVACQ